VQGGGDAVLDSKHPAGGAQWVIATIFSSVAAAQKPAEDLTALISRHRVVETDTECFVVFAARRRFSAEV
jgi:hypothetical protein